jgi:alcohol dehydrogenase class IV
MRTYKLGIFLIQPGSLIRDCEMAVNNQCYNWFKAAESQEVPGMWYFRSAQIAFGDDALSHLEQIQGKRAFIISDSTVQNLGFIEMVQKKLARSSIQSDYYLAIEPEPSLKSVRQAAEEMSRYSPDWVIGLGGGSCMDAAKAAWMLYERPDIDVEAINPVEDFGLRAKARLILIPTTAGSGSEVSWGVVLKDDSGRRKLEMSTYEFLPDIAIVDPRFSAQMPDQLTADSGIDVLCHVVEGINNSWSNDFTDGLCLKAARLVFQYLPRAIEGGSGDLLAREKMANAATIAGIVITNCNIALAHSFGHSAGPILKIPHGRITGLFLPYVVEYLANGGVGRYQEMAMALGLPSQDETQAAASLADAIRNLMVDIHLATNLQQAGVSRELFEAELDEMCERVLTSIGIVMSRRFPDLDDVRRIFEYAYSGRKIDF